jgi:hypothetical protein
MPYNKINFDEFDSKKIKRLIIDLLPIVVCAVILVSFFSCDWFKNWMGNLSDTNKIILLGAITFIIIIERRDTYKRLKDF